MGQARLGQDETKMIPSPKKQGKVLGYTESYIKKHVVNITHIIETHINRFGLGIMAGI